MTTRKGAVAGALVLFTVLVATTAVAQTAGFDFVDITDFPTVRVVITPPPGTDPAAIADLRVFQDGVELPAEVFPLNLEPVEMILLLDSSGSMAGAPIAAAKQAAIDFIAALPAGSEVEVLTFNNGVSVVATAGASPAELAAAVSGIVAGGNTALYDATVAAAQALNRTSTTRQFIVLLTDGGDTASTATLEQAVAALAAKPVGFYAISLAGTDPDPAALATLAEAATGTVVEAANSSALAAVYTDVAQRVVSQYAVVFEAANGGQSTLEAVIGDGTDAVRFSASLLLPRPPTTGPRVVITLPPEAAPALTPPTTTVIGAPGRFEGPMALAIGIGLLAITLAVVFAVALQPVTDQVARGPLVPGAQIEPAGGRRRMFGMLARRGGRLLTTRRQRGIDAALEAAGISLTAGEYLVIVVLAALGGMGLGLLLNSPMLIIILVIGAIVLPRSILARAANRRRALFADQLEGTLQLIAGSLRAGYGLAQSFSTVAVESPSPTAEEIGRVVIETRVGRDLVSALRAAAARMKNDDFLWVADAIAIQQEVGGNLAEVLDSVGGTIRDRNQIRRQIHTLSAEGRISAVVLIALPFVAAGLLAAANPGYLDPLFTTRRGIILLILGSVLIVLGILWIRRIVKIVF